MAHKNIPMKSKFGFESDSPIINNNTDHNVLPGGTTVQRIASPPERAQRLNTETNKIEYYVNGQWRSAVNSDDLLDLDDNALIYAIIMS